jgi:deoxyadenosine/deoxycytidine kinase
MAFERSKLLSANLKPGQLTLVDSGMLMSWVYAHSHLLVNNFSIAEWDFFVDLYNKFAQDLLSKDSAVIILNYKVETLMKRIQKRGRDYEIKHYTEEYLKQVQQGLEALERQLLSFGVQVIKIDESEVADFEANSTDANRLIALVKAGLAG